MCPPQRAASARPASPSLPLLHSTGVVAAVRRGTICGRCCSRRDRPARPIDTHHSDLQRRPFLCADRRGGDWCDFRSLSHVAPVGAVRGAWRQVWFFGGLPLSPAKKIPSQAESRWNRPSDTNHPGFGNPEIPEVDFHWNQVSV